MTTFLSFLIIALVIIGLVQIVRIIEIATKLKAVSRQTYYRPRQPYNALAMLLVGMGFTILLLILQVVGTPYSSRSCKCTRIGIKLCGILPHLILFNFSHRPYYLYLVLYRGKRETLLYFKPQ